MAAGITIERGLGFCCGLLGPIGVVLAAAELSRYGGQQLKLVE